MGKTAIKWCITAAMLILLGSTLLTVAACSADWDLTKIGAVEFTTNTYDLAEEFNNISIKTDTADVVLESSADEKCKVVCFEKKNATHTVTVNNGTLSIRLVDNRRWYERFGGLKSPEITVYLPKTEYDALSVNASTGDILIPHGFTFDNIDVALTTGDVRCSASANDAVRITASTGKININDINAASLSLNASTGSITVNGATVSGNIRADVSTGKVKLTDVTCKSLTSSGSTGDITLTSVVAEESFTIDRSTGDVEFERSDAADIYVKTDTGDVEGSLLSAKVFITKTDTGRVRVPNTATGGRCEITTDTGDIEITIS